MKSLYLALICLILPVQALSDGTEQKTSAVELKMTPLSTKVSPFSPAKLEVALINRSKIHVWISHRWLFGYFAKDANGEHMLNYPMVKMMAPTKEDFVRLRPSEGVHYQTQINWNMLPEQDRKPGKKTFKITVNLEMGDSVGIDAVSGMVSSDIQLHVAGK